MWLAAAAIRALEAQRREATFANPYIGSSQPTPLTNLHDQPQRRQRASSRPAQELQPRAATGFLAAKALRG